MPPTRVVTIYGSSYSCCFSCCRCCCAFSICFRGTAARLVNKIRRKMRTSDAYEQPNSQRAKRKCHFVAHLQLTPHLPRPPSHAAILGGVIWPALTSVLSRVGPPPSPSSTPFPQPLCQCLQIAQCLFGCLFVGIFVCLWAVRHKSSF